MIILFLSIATYFQWRSFDLYLWSWNCWSSFYADHACVGSLVLLYWWPEGGGKKENRQCKKKKFIYSWSAMMRIGNNAYFCVFYWCGIICKIKEQRHHYWPQVVVQWMQPLTWCYNKKQSPRRWRQKLPGGPLEWSTFGKNSPKHSSNQIDFWLILLFTNISFFG